MALTYATNLTELALLGQFDVTDPNFLSNLPTCIQYATDRITRELNLLATTTVNTSLHLTASSRVLDMSAINPNVVYEINVLTPAGTSNPDLGFRNPLTISSTAFLNQVYGTAPAQGGVTGVPQYFAMLTDTTVWVGPFPDAAYSVEIIGTTRPVPISASNQSNWISTYLPDLFLAAEMVQLSGYMRNFGSQADDPKMAMSWESQYVSLRDSAGVEDAMRRYYATGWTPQLPNAYNPART